MGDAPKRLNTSISIISKSKAAGKAGMGAFGGLNYYLSAGTKIIQYG